MQNCALRRSGIPRIGSWFTQTHSRRGSVYDIGVHALDRALYLMGEFEAASVTARLSPNSARAAGRRQLGQGEINPTSLRC
jgi:predicted dehydrogenase